MERGLILLVAALVAYMASGVQGTSHLSFSNETVSNINRTGCGTTKLCVETPGDCDPSGSSPCLFASVASGTTVPNTGVPLSIELSGNSSGYIALGLTLNATEGITMLYICAQNSTSGMFFFRTRDRNNTNGNLTTNERRVTAIRGTVNGTMIQCQFNRNVNSSNTRSDAMFVVLLGSGPLTGGDPGAFNIDQESRVLDLQNPASNLPTTTTTTTVTPTVNPTMDNPTMSNTTMANGSGAVQPHAVLLLLSVLALSVMLRA